MILAAWAQVLLAAGFAVSELGTQTLGLAGAGTARKGCEAVFYNPALADERAACVGLALIYPFLSHSSSGQEDVAPPGLGTPPYAYAVWPWDLGNLTVGLSTPFGSALSWGETWRGRYQATRSELLVLEPSFSVTFRPWQAAGLSVGVRPVYGTVALAKAIDTPSSKDAQVTLEGSSFGLGYQASLALGLGPLGLSAVRLGAHYRSRATLGFEGAARFEGVPVELSDVLTDGQVATRITLPDRLALGLAYVTEQSGVYLDLERQGFAVFETLAIDFVNPETPDSEERRDWHDTWALRFGAETQALVSQWALRFGLAYDPSPVPKETLSPALPDADRLVFTLGGSWKVSRIWSVDVALAWLELLEAQSTYEAFPGSYDGRAFVASVGATVKL